MAVRPSVTAVLLHHCVMDRRTDSVLLVQVREEMAVLPAVSAVLLHHSAMDKLTDCDVVIKG